MAKRKSDIKPGGVSEYIAKCPKDVQAALKSTRAAVRQVVPDAVETVSYFNWPGYHYDGNYPYNGMFAWFSYKRPYIRLHILPVVIKAYTKQLARYPTSTGVINFPEEKVPTALVKKLVKASVKAMKASAK